MSDLSTKTGGFADRIMDFIDSISIEKTKSLIAVTIKSMAVLIAILIALDVVYFCYRGLTDDVVEEAVIVPAPANGKEYTNIEKGIIVSNAVISMLEQNVESGWIPNNMDLTAFLDNKAEYQTGIYMDTRALVEIFVDEFAVHGEGDTKYDALDQAIEAGFGFYPDIPIATTMIYTRAINTMKQWQQDLINGENGAVYNVKSDDLFKILEAMRASIKTPLAALKDKTTEDKVDNIIYRAKGYAANHRVILQTLKVIHPEEIVERGGAVHMEKALQLLEEINNFNPWYCHTWFSHNTKLSAKVDNYQLLLKNIKDALDK